MQARVTKAEGTRRTFEIELDLGPYRTLSECEEAVQQAVNQAGVLMTAEAMKLFDADGQPLVREGASTRPKARSPSFTRRPSGRPRWSGMCISLRPAGRTFCPLEDRAGIVLSATPRFARMIASKFAEFGSAHVQADMAENHGRTFSRGLVAHVAEAVAALAEFQADQTIYHLPDFENPTVTLVVGLDEVEISSRPTRATAAIGSVSFYDVDGRRQYALYVTDLFEWGSPADPPQPDRGRFARRMNDELDRALHKQQHKAARLIGVSGGQPWGVEFLDNWLTRQRNVSERTDDFGREWEIRMFIDPDRVIDTIARAAQAYFEQVQRAGLGEGDDSRERTWRRRERAGWLEMARGRLRSAGGITSIVADLQAWLRDPLPDEGRASIAEALDFLTQQHSAGRLDYQEPAAWLMFANGGILAGLADAVLGDRLKHPKFKIGVTAARAILILRELTRTPGRWEEFWDRVTRQP